MKAIKRIVGKLVAGGIIACALTSNLQAESYWSAKDPDLPPLPFNKHPELPVVEIEKGKFLVDDTSIPDTPEQAESRKRRQEAAERAKAIASDPVLWKAAQEAQQAAREAAWKKNREEIEPWLVSTLPTATGEPATRESMEAARKSELVSLTASLAGKRAATLQVATNMGTPTELVFDNGERAFLAGFEGGQPVWNMSDGITQAVSIATAQVWPGGGAGYALAGTNITMGLWEAGGIPRLTHQEFQSRVTVLDGTTNVDSHATGVASVLNGAGPYNVIYPAGVTNYQAAKGMSYAAPVLANNLDNDQAEMAGAVVTNALKVSNHSYSITCGWRWLGAWVWFGDTNVSQSIDWKFGAYTTEAAAIDATVAAARTYLPVWTPGNSRNEGPPTQPTNHYVFVPPNSFAPVTGVTRSIDGDSGGYDSIHPQGNAKNILTVGAVSNLVNGYAGTGSVQVGDFSPFGPTDDGRVKPDVVAPGVDIIMADSPADTAFQLGSGTSFAAPAISGSINLLDELRTSLHTNSRPWLASCMKGLVIHTADEADGTGPDYKYGWGLMNTRRAADLIRNNATNGWKSFIKEAFLANGGSIEFPVLALDGTNALKVTICWTDPAGTSVTNVVDPVAPRLVNDLDLRVISPTGTTNFPWVLNPDLTNQSSTVRATLATTGDDTRNNVEQVVITNAVASNYVIRVTHKGSLGTNGQWVSLLLGGVQAQSKPSLVISPPSVTASNKLAFAWPSVVGQLYQVQYLDNFEGASWSNWDGEISATKTNTAVEVDMTGPDGRRFYRVKEVE
ncbi:MAG: S8 family serine peptidase [Verrucomicrobia bacterium]|nr:S8 family serine peptidase [Verrucomicrobiota bacterium]